MNETGHTIEAESCERLFHTFIAGEAYREENAVAADCIHQFLIPMGESRWPVIVEAVQRGEPCLDGACPPAVPRGEYQVFATNPFLPAPEPITVVVD